MLLSGAPPFDGNSDHDIFAAIKKGVWRFNERFSKVSANAKDFITACLTFDAHHRMSAKAGLNHLWFKQLKQAQAKDAVSLDVVDRLKGTSVSNGNHTILQLSKFFVIFLIFAGFGTRSQLAQLCMEVVVHTLQPDQIDHLRKEFMKFDVTNAGEISFHDMKSCLQSMLSERDIEDIFSKVDYDNSGKINYHEFLAATVSRSAIKEENMLVAFERISNNQKYITGKDIHNLLGAETTEVEVGATKC